MCPETHEPDLTAVAMLQGPPFPHLRDGVGGVLRLGGGDVGLRGVFHGGLHDSLCDLRLLLGLGQHPLLHHAGLPHRGLGLGLLTRPLLLHAYRGRGAE